ncbi:MAG: NAD(P)-binding domain-containing protein [Chloroflexi bacterium]|nr:NAD(P)-binding domain-containing protein [Chloroflexota bacterium]
MNEKLETVIIGGGQAGLATSYWLKQHQREHLILEQAAQAANAWRNDRWDSFTLVTPNWATRMPGTESPGTDPNGFIPRDELVAYFEQYVERFQLPIRYNTRVTSVEQDDQGYIVRTDDGTFSARNVVVATGLFQRPKIPAFGAQIGTGIAQLHSGAYRNPDSIPPGAVLVVGSAQSGCQIAEELYQSGRKVYLCVGSAPRVPRRYRGKDIYEWAHLTGFLDRTPDKLPSPKARFAGNPQVSGKNGGHTLNLHQFARDGVTLLGRIAGATDHTISLAPDLKENLAKVDGLEINFCKMVDGYIAQNGLDAPREELPQLRDGYDAPEILDLDLRAAGISTIIWAMGYRFDFSLVRLPMFDADGFPVQQRGVTSCAGLYFVGMPWMPTQRSGLLLGVGEAAEHIANHIDQYNQTV